jgi:hypothetical protein
MGRRSSIDQHPERARIERDLALKVPVRKVAKKYGVSRDALNWHRRHKIPSQLSARLLGQALKREEDLEKLRTEESEGLLANLAAQRARILLAQDKALDRDELGVVAQLAGQIHKNLSLVGHYLGEFAQHAVHTNINILIRPEYLELRSALIRALQPHPDARRAIIDVFHQVEAAAGDPHTIEVGDAQDRSA